MRKLLTIFLVLVLVFTRTAYAIFGIGDVVFDPSNYEEALQQFAQLEQQYQQLVQTYQVVQSQYQQMLRMAQNLSATTLLRYKAASAPWPPFSADDAYGNAASWINGLNSGAGTVNAYSQATESLGSYGTEFGQIPADQQTGVKAAYATVELEDGANRAAMQTLGQMRANAAATEAAIENLQNDTLSADPALNTEVALLNKINAAGVVQLHTAESANQLLAALTESRVIESKRQRDAEARAFNQHMAFVQNEQAELAAQTAGASQAMLAWRMP